MMRKYLQLTRAHTAPLEMVPAIAGAALGSGVFYSVDVALWGIFGLLYHLTGYGMNSYVDWKKGFDKEDENKQHHPLNSGLMSKEEAQMVIIGLFSITTMHFLYISHENITAVALMSSGVLAGMLYNYFGKVTELKFVPIAYAHSMVFLSGYIATGGSNRIVALGIAMWVLFWVTYQIAISGEVKDMTQEESNLAKMMGGTSVRGYVEFPRSYILTAFAIKLFQLAIGLAVVYRLRAGLVGEFMIVVFGLASLFLTGKLLADGKFNRNTRLNIMAAIELFSVFMTAAFLTQIAGLLGVFLICAASGSWVVLFNKLMWGTNLRPDV